MATASRMRPPAGSKPRAAIPNLTALLVFDALRTWVIPVVAGAVIVAAAALPAAGHRAIDLVLEGKLSPNPTGGAAAPVHYRLTLESAGARQVVEGQFDDTLKTQRLGRRGTTVVHQSHSSELRVLANPGREDLSITQLSLEPPTAPAVTVSAFAHPLPGPVILGIAVAALLAGVIAFDRLAAVAATDG